MHLQLLENLFGMRMAVDINGKTVMAYSYILKKQILYMEITLQEQLLKL